MKKILYLLSFLLLVGFVYADEDIVKLIGSPNRFTRLYANDIISTDGNGISFDPDRDYVYEILFNTDGSITSSGGLVIDTISSTGTVTISADTDNDNTGDILFQTQGNDDKVIITNAGKLGVGTTSPATSVQIEGGSLRLSDTTTPDGKNIEWRLPSGTTRHMNIDNVSDSDGSNSRLRIFSEDSSDLNGKIIMTVDEEIRGVVIGDTEVPRGIFHVSTTSVFNAFIVEDTGNVGIGLDNATEKLEVYNGNIKTNYGVNAATGVFTGNITSDTTMYAPIGDFDDIYVSSITGKSDIYILDNLNLSGNNITNIGDIGTTGTLNVDTIAEDTASAGVTIEDINITDNVISSTASDLNITPNTGDDVVIDGHWEFDGITLSALTDNDTYISAYSGKNITIEGVIFDGSVVSGVNNLTATTLYSNNLTAWQDANTNITAYTGRNVTMESVTFDGGVVAGISDLTASTINAYSLGGKLTGGANEIEGSSFDINGGDLSAITISGGLTWSAAQNFNEDVTISGGSTGIKTLKVKGSGDNPAKLGLEYGIDANAKIEFGAYSGDIQTHFGSSISIWNINHNNDDVNVIIKGDTDNNLLNIDAGNNNVNIGQTSGSEKFNVTGNSVFNGELTATALECNPQGSAPSTDDGTIYYNSSSNDFQFRENGTWETLNGGTTTFLGLGDTPSSYTAANAIYTTNGTPDAVAETSVILTEGTNTFNITKGTAILDIAAGSTVNVDASLAVESASTVNQDLTSDASPTFNAGTYTAELNVRDLTIEDTSPTLQFSDDDDDDFYIRTSGDDDLHFWNGVSGSHSHFKFFCEDGDGTNNVSLSLFGVGTSASTTNSEYLEHIYRYSDSEFEIHSRASGTGTARDLEIFTENNTNQIRLETDGTVGFGKAVANGVIDIDLSTEDLSIDDAGSAAATEQDWIEVTVGGNTGYIRVYATK